MPYYKCPKCGGRATYRGTELVSGSKVGGAIIGPENDLGFSPVVGVGGRTTTSEQTVVKCKTCDINLGQKDIRYSKEELLAAGFDEEFIGTIAKRVRLNQYKRRPPIIAKLANRTINLDYRYARDWGV